MLQLRTVLLKWRLNDIREHLFVCDVGVLSNVLQNCRNSASLQIRALGLSCKHCYTNSQPTTTDCCRSIGRCCRCRGSYSWSPRRKWRSPASTSSLWPAQCCWRYVLRINAST